MSIPYAHGLDLLDWYTRRARAFLDLHAGQDLPAIDAQAVRLEQLSKTVGEEVAVCFLGAAGVGKSTLLNALVSDRYNILPHGGVGPLTAQATVVRYAESPYFRASYFPAKVLNKVLFALERAHERTATIACIDADDVATQLDEEDRREAEATLPMLDESGRVEGPCDKLDAYRHQVRLMIQGRQEGEIDTTYLMDALRAALSLPARWGRAPTPDDAARIECLRACLQLARNEGVHRERHAHGDMRELLMELRDHASGYLAPLIQRLEVGWNADVLRDGLVLVDLPGVGVANDEYRRVTAEWVRVRARAIALVVDRAGITEASAELLRSTGFLNRLLLDGNEPGVDPVSLSTIMVKVDQSADSAWHDETDFDEVGARSWSDHFRELRGRAIELMRAQVRQELDKLAADGHETLRSDRAAVLAQVLETMQAHAVSAPQFRSFQVPRKDAPPRIDSAEESGIPAVRAALHDLAIAHRERLRARAADAAESFRERIDAAISMVRAQWEADERAEREAQALSDDLEAFLAPRQRELDARRGAFREFLHESVSTLIQSEVQSAAHVAREEINRYLRRLGELPWGTLAATVRKGGAHVNSKGKRIDLPNELALRFEEPVAVIWSKQILAALRKRTSVLGQDYVEMVGEVVAWARGQDARVQPRFVEALHDNLTAQTKDLSSIGKDAVDELKGKVRTQLYEELVKKVRRRCERFVLEGSNHGLGVKRRILELYGELAEEVVKVGQPIATEILLGNYREVEQEIAGRFNAYRNPLDGARDAIVRSHEDSVRRSDAQRRKRVLAEIDAILDARPRGANYAVYA
ncbi:dynamin family protein [Sorangium cellulosum]|uniref:dynamin family protein n=1 Tax=Sorangium cellulosum TaxID=56 RepID=UPI0009D79803|nr:dynamin family protein [Sorangium cellulosum]